MLQIRRYKWREHAIPVCLLLVTALTFSFSTYFFFYSNGSYGHDAGIFAYVGSAMKEGRTLYTEVWENKGPLLYFINMLGVTLNYDHGIYFLELAALFVAALFAYKTALMLTNRWIATIAAIFCMLPLAYTLQSGNLSEEYALPFMCVGLYFATKFYAQDHSLKNYEMIIFGACMGAVFLLRANILMLFAAIIIVTVVVLIREKSFKMLGRLFAFSLMGFVLFILPFALYLILRGALSACLDTAYFGILNSFVELPKVTVLRNIRYMIETFGKSGAYYLVIVFLISFIAVLVTRRIKDKNMRYMLYIAALALVLNLWANSLAGVAQMHYFMSFLPILVIPAAWLFHLLYTALGKVSKERVVRVLGTFAVVLFLSFNAISEIPGIILNNIRTVETPDALYNRVAKYVEKNTQPDELVQFFGGAESVTANYRTRRLAGSKYSYYANGSFTPETKAKFATEIVEDLEKSKPRLIIFDNRAKYEDFVSNMQNEDLWDRLVEDHYSLQKEVFASVVYKRND